MADASYYDGCATARKGANLTGAVLSHFIETGRRAGVNLLDPTPETEAVWDALADARGLPCFADICHDISTGNLV